MTTIKQGSQEWLDFRKDKIGGSDAPVIMEVSPYETPYGLWMRKMGLKEERFYNAAMKHGNGLEDQARRKLEKILGVELSPIVTQCKENPWRIASLDGKSICGDVIVEIKCPYKYENHLKVKGSKKIPIHHIPQTQHNMGVDKCKKLIYFSYVSDDDFVLLEDKKDEKYQEELFKKELEFYTRMQKFDPPETPESLLKEREDPDWIIEANRIKEALPYINELKKWEKTVEEAKKKLIQMAEGEAWKGGGIVLKNSVAKGNVDYKAIPELQNVNLDKYRKDPIVRWSLREI